MGIAICMVIIGHLLNFKSDSNICFRICHLFFKDVGSAGVNIFFFLSAYGLGFSWENNSASIYFKHRITRIFPLYILFLAISLTWFVTEEHPLLYSFTQITGLSMFLNHTHEWFIPSLLIIYFLYPLLYKGLAQATKQNYLNIFFIIITCTYLYYIIPHNFIHPCFLARWNAIILGICAYQQNKGNLTRKQIWTIFVLVALLTFITTQDCCFYFYIPIILLVIDELKLKMPLKQFFCILGKHSLEIYLGQTIGLQYFFASSIGNIWITMTEGLLLSCFFSLLFIGFNALYHQTESKIALWLKKK